MSLVRFDKINHKYSYNNLAYYINNHMMFYNNFPKTITKGIITRIHPIVSYKIFSTTHPYFMYFR